MAVTERSRALSLDILEKEFAGKAVVPEHVAFYLRGIMNSMVTHYLPNKLPSTVTEDDV